MEHGTISLKEAAALTGKTKATILNRINHKTSNKRLPAVRDSKDQWQIQVCDLEKHYKLNTQTKQPIDTKLDDTERLKLEHKLALSAVKIEQLTIQLEKSEMTSQQFHDLAQQNGKLIAHYVDGEPQPLPRKKFLGIF